MAIHIGIPTPGGTILGAGRDQPCTLEAAGKVVRGTVKTATEAVGRLHSTARSHQRIIAAEVMSHKTGSATDRRESAYGHRS